MKKNIVFILIAAFILSSCELLEDNTSNGLSDTEIIEGLKTALEVGTDSATSNLHATDGYLMNEAVKILLPPDAEIITSNINLIASRIPGGKALLESQLDDLVISLNRAAEDAADDALPIITSAITKLSIQDGWDILHGTVPINTKSTSSDFDSLAATHYFDQQTRSDLISVFSQPINTSLNKPLVGNTSTNDIWSSITSNYNTAVDLYNLFSLTDLEKVNSNLGEYATDKALDGLFLKIGEEEKKIRRNPYEWAIDILQKVFGSLLN